MCDSTVRGIFPHALRQLSFAGYGEDIFEANQLVPMQSCKAINGSFASTREVDLDLASIGASRVAFNQPKPLATRYERHDAVVLGLQPLSQFRNRGPFTLREPLDVKQQKVLQVGDACAASQLFAEEQKAA